MKIPQCMIAIAILPLYYHYRYRYTITTAIAMLCYANAMLSPNYATRTPSPVQPSPVLRKRPNLSTPHTPNAHRPPHQDNNNQPQQLTIEARLMGYTLKRPVTAQPQKRYMKNHAVGKKRKKETPCSIPFPLRSSGFDNKPPHPIPNPFSLRNLYSASVR